MTCIVFERECQEDYRKRVHNSIQERQNDGKGPPKSCWLLTVQLSPTAARRRVYFQTIKKLFSKRRSPLQVGQITTADARVPTIRDLNVVGNAANFLFWLGSAQWKQKARRETARKNREVHYK